jgi:hypothetical protein
MKRWSVFAGLIEWSHRFCINMFSLDVVHFEITRCPGEHRLSIKILPLGSKHLGRMHFEGASPFRHPDTF